MFRRDKAEAAIANLPANLAQAVAAVNKRGNKVKPPNQAAVANLGASLTQSVNAVNKRGRKDKS